MYYSANAFVNAIILDTQIVAYMIGYITADKIISQWNL